MDAAAAGFNARGGINGRCIEVHRCIDRPNRDCAAEFVEHEAIATVNDGPASREILAEQAGTAGIPRLGLVAADGVWEDPNAYPLSGWDVLVMPYALDASGATAFGVVRHDAVGLSAVGAAVQAVAGDSMQFAGEFVLGPPGAWTAEQVDALVAQVAGSGVDGLALGLDPAAAVALIQAVEAAGLDLGYAVALQDWSTAEVAELGEAASRVTFVGTIAPPGSMLPAVETAIADFAAADDPALAVDAIDGEALRSWVGLYSLVAVLRSDPSVEVEAASVAEVLPRSEPLPMLGLTTDWMPDGAPATRFRLGVDHRLWSVSMVAGEPPSWTATDQVSLSDLICGTPIGEPCG